MKRDYHMSDCATNNAPALPVGECNCGLEKHLTEEPNTSNMKLTVQDLAMFIGCDCEIIKADIPEQHKDHFSKVGDVVKVEPVLLLLISQRDIEIKPILRPLSDMTEEEIEFVIYQIMDSEIHLDADSRITKEEVTGCVELIEPDDNAMVVNFSLRCFIGRLYLSSHSGNIRLFDENDKEQPIEWRPELYRYLLSQHFDVFGWIEKGLAIDKTKTPREL